jgi:hypothetical protein
MNERPKTTNPEVAMMAIMIIRRITNMTNPVTCLSEQDSGAQRRTNDDFAKLIDGVGPAHQGSFRMVSREDEEQF